MLQGVEKKKIIACLSEDLKKRIYCIEMKANASTVNIYFYWKDMIFDSLEVGGIFKACNKALYPLTIKDYNNWLYYGFLKIRYTKNT